jgi:dihydrofolate reductase
MSRLIITTATTVDGVIDGFEWYVSEGGHDQAGRDQFKGAGAMLLGRKTYEGLAAFWPIQEGPHSWPRTATERAWRTTPERMVPPRPSRFAR